MWLPIKLHCNMNLKINKLNKICNIFYKLANSKLDELISTYPSDIVNFIKDIKDDALKGHAIGILKKYKNIHNKNLSLEELKLALENKNAEKLDLNTEEEKNIAEKTSQKTIKKETFKIWILRKFREIRARRKIENLSEDQKNQYKKFLESLDLIADWYNSELPDIDSYSADSAIDAQREWHDYMAGRGEGLRYDPVNQSLIQYGPIWKNNKFNGHYIIEIKSENDLLAEGNMMHNCIGDYTEELKNGSMRFFSLRTSENKPLVSIGTDPEIKNFTKDKLKAHSNSEPDVKEKEMIKEWVEEKLSSSGKPKFDGSLDIIDLKLLDLDETSEAVDNFGKNDYGMDVRKDVDFVKLYKVLKNKISHAVDYGDRMPRSAYDTISSFAHRLLESDAKLENNSLEIYKKSGNIPKVIEIMNDEFNSALDFEPTNISPEQLGIRKSDYINQTEFYEAFEKAVQEYEKKEHENIIKNFMPFVFINTIKNDLKSELENFKNNFSNEIYSYIKTLIG